jgi:hypothetical protein
MSPPSGIFFKPLFIYIQQIGLRNGFYGLGRGGGIILISNLGCLHTVACVRSGDGGFFLFYTTSLS